MNDNLKKEYTKEYYDYFLAHHGEEGIIDKLFDVSWTWIDSALNQAVKDGRKEGMQWSKNAIENLIDPPQAQGPTKSELKSQKTE